MSWCECCLPSLLAAFSPFASSKYEERQWVHRHMLYEMKIVQHTLVLARSAII